MIGGVEYNPAFTAALLRELCVDKYLVPRTTGIRTLSAQPRSRRLRIKHGPVFTGDCSTRSLPAVSNMVETMKFHRRI